MEQYPLILDGAEAGWVSVERDGGWTVFSVQCAAVQGIVRVSVYGGGREGYLGVLAPDGNGLTLRRRFSRSQMRDFPAEIAFAARAGQPCEAPEPEPTIEAEPTAEAEPELQEAPAKTEEAPPDLEDVYWYASPDGALVSFDGENHLIALPAGDARIPDGPGGWPKTIEGKNYMVYRTKDGKLLR